MKWELKRILYEISSMIIHILRSPPLPTPFPSPFATLTMEPSFSSSSSSSSSRQNVTLSQVSPTAFASLFLGISLVVGDFCDWVCAVAFGDGFGVGFLGRRVCFQFVWTGSLHSLALCVSESCVWWMSLSLSPFLSSSQITLRAKLCLHWYWYIIIQ